MTPDWYKGGSGREGGREGGREDRREEEQEEEDGGYCHKSASSKESKMINSEAAGSQRLRVVSRTSYCQLIVRSTDISIF